MRIILLCLTVCFVVSSSSISYSGMLVGGDKLTETLYTSRQSNCTENNIMVSARPGITSVGLIEIHQESGETTLRDLDGTCIKQKWEIHLIDDRQFSDHAKQCCEVALTKYREWVKLKEKSQSFDIFKPFNECMLNKSLVELNRTSVNPSSFYIGLSYSHNPGVLVGKFRVKKAETSFYGFLFDLESCCDDLRKTESIAIEATKSPPDSTGGAVEGASTSTKDFANTLRKCMINRRYDAEEIK